MGREGNAPSRQAGDRAEETLERLGEVVRNEVFVNCNKTRRSASGRSTPRRQRRIPLPCIMVVQEARAFDNDVSPQRPMTAGARRDQRWHPKADRGGRLTLAVLDETGDEIVESKRIDGCISVDHEEVLWVRKVINPS